MLISEGGKPRNNFLKGQTKNPSSIAGGGGGGGGWKIKLNGPRCYNSNFSFSIWTLLFPFYQHLQVGLGILRGVACKDRAKLEIGPKIANFETLSE